MVAAAAVEVVVPIQQVLVVTMAVEEVESEQMHSQQHQEQVFKD
jgi:hypothetical protein